jgi:DNA repair protein RecN (Recombination protein N)
MLAQLRIKDFILIKEQEIFLNEGLNVLTGETGAGKSIVLQAIQILLGSKPKGDLLRPGAEEALVEGLFILDKVPESIKTELPDLLQGDELTISRSINAAGRSKIYVNGRLSSLQILETLRSRLVNICSQNQQVRLLDSKYHLETLDGFINKPSDIQAYQDLFRQHSQAAHELLRLEEGVTNLSSKNQQNQEILDELSELKLELGRRQSLEQQLKKQQGAERIIELCSQLSVEMSSESALTMTLRSIQQKATEIAKFDEDFGSEISNQLSALRSSVSDIDLGVSRYLSKIDLNQEVLECIRTELAELARVMRKYKCDEEQLAALCQKAQTELSMGFDSVALEKSRKLVLELESKLKLKADNLSDVRRKAAKNLEKQVVLGLQELNLKGAKFEVHFTKKALGLDGQDLIEFKLSTNAGMALKALKDVASGGELSRILLVLKQVLREVSGVNVLVFDEVDTGISGSVARAVGEKLKDLSRFSQVLCITHLAQVASLADHHLIVKKQQDKLATTVVDSIDGDNRVDEIARMISGHAVTKASRESARELLGII